MDAIVDRPSIKRDDFKYNFLMTGIIRLDYSGVIDIEDIIIKDLTSELRTSGYTEYDEGFINELSFKLIDPIKIETLRSVPLEEFVKNKSYKFKNPSNNNIIEITKFFIALTIDYSTSYSKFEDYIYIFIAIAKKLRDHYPFIRPLRIGERKINSLFIYDEKRIRDYFKDPYFVYPYSNINLFDKPSEWIIHNAVDTLQFENMFVNISRNINTGKLKINTMERRVSRLFFDVDCYSSGRLALYLLNKNNLNKLQDLEDKLLEFNEVGFKLYKNAITDEFIKKLISEEEFRDDNLEGVKRSQL